MKTGLASDIPRLKELLPAFRKVRVAVLGDLMLDRYLWGEASRLSPEAAVPVVNFESQSDFPGGAGNVAANLAALGANVQVFGVVGGREVSGKVVDDDSAAALRSGLRKAHISERAVLADPQHITTVKARVIARHQQIVRIDYERHDLPSQELEEKLFRLLLAALKSTHALLLSDYDKGLISETFAERVLNACHKFKVPVFVKPKTSRLYAYRGARAIVCNEKEAGHYANLTLSDEKSVEEAGRALLARFASTAILITRRSKGMSLFEESSPRFLHIPATSFEVTYARAGQFAVESQALGRQVYDVTGAGDTVLSVFSLAAAAGASLPDAAFLANVAAGVVVRKLGTATVTPAELTAALQDQRRR